MGQITNEVEEEEEKPKYNHFTHEHPLELNISHQTKTPTCSGCKRNISADKDFYTCKTCSFSLHRACYNMARIYHHSAEPGHELNLLLLPFFDCKACGLSGSGFCYNCRVCAFNYHTLCLRMPLEEFCASHQHLLKLEFSSPYENCKGFRCDVCANPGSDHWLYRCSECEFDVHINCVYSVPNPQFQFQNLSNFTSQIRAPPGETSTSYVNPSPSAPYTNIPNPSGNYMFNPGNSIVPSNNSHGSGQGVLGAGAGGLLATGIITGIGEGIGQEIVQGIFNGLGDVGLGNSDQATYN